MKIVFVSDCYPSKEQPQYCIFLQQQAKALMSFGHSVLVIRPILHSKENKKECYTFCGVDIVDIFIRTSKIDNYYCNLYSRLYDMDINWLQFDVVSIHLTSVPVFEAVIHICSKLCVPTVVHFHGLNVWSDYYQKNSTIHKLYYWIQERRKLAYLKKVDAIVGVSNCVCEEVKKKINRNCIYTVYNGVDLNLFSSFYKCKPKQFTILCVANLIPIKGHRFLLQAVANLHKQGYNILVKLIGVGVEKDSLKNLAIELKLEDNVEFCGAKPYDVVAKFMSEADMFIMPSYYEAFGCVYVEAMGSGVVTCGCNILGASEIIQDQVNGLLFKPKDVISIENAIKSILLNPQLRKTIEQNAVERAKDFTWEQSAKQLLSVYSKILTKDE